MGSATVIPIASESVESTTVMKRYQDAYQTAKSTMEFAENVKLVGIFVAGVIFVCALVAFLFNPAGRFAFPVLSAWLVAGSILVVLASHLWSVMLRVGGQLLQITVDLAVDSSPLLSDAQRARIIPWPKPAETAASVQQRAA